MTVDDHLRLYRNLKALREVAKYTQTELAAKVGLCRSSYGQIERGIRAPDLDTLHALCKIYHVTLDMLIGCDVQTVLNEYFLYESNFSEVRRLLQIYSQLSLWSKGRLMERAENLCEMDGCRKHTAL